MLGFLLMPPPPRTGYEDLERRCFSMNDLLLGPDPLLAACVADDCLALELADGPDLSPARQRLTWEEYYQKAVDDQARQCWRLCVLVLGEPE
jgi:hypothetical protein